MAKQPLTEPSDDQSKSFLFSSLCQLCNLDQCALMKQLFMCSNILILSGFFIFEGIGMSVG